MTQLRTHVVARTPTEMATAISRTAATMGDMPFSMLSLNYWSPRLINIPTCVRLCRPRTANPLMALSVGFYGMQSALAWCGQTFLTGVPAAFLIRPAGAEPIGFIAAAPILK